MKNKAPLLIKIFKWYLCKGDILISCHDDTIKHIFFECSLTVPYGLSFRLLRIHNLAMFSWAIISLKFLVDGYVEICFSIQQFHLICRLSIIIRTFFNSEKYINIRKISIIISLCNYEMSRASLDIKDAHVEKKKKKKNMALAKMINNTH